MMDFKAKLLSIKELTHDVRMFVFERPEGFEFKPGQFVMLQFDGIARAYSIASPPTEKEKLVLIIKLIEGGRGSEYLRGAKEGDELQFKGPFGHFCLDEESEKDVVLVGTGTGLAPLYSILSYLLDTGSERKIRLFFGVRYEKDVFFEDQFGILKEEYGNFDYKITLSRPENGDGKYVTDLLKEENFGNIQVYICGGKAMVEDVKGLFPDAKSEVY